MEKEIQKIIEQHLPEQTAGVMKEYIEGAELTEETLRATQGIVKKHEITITEQGEKLRKFGDIKDAIEELNARHEAHDMRESEITKREESVEVIESRIRMEMMNNNMSNMHELVSKIFGHPAVTVTKTGHIVTGQGVQNNYGGWDGATYSEPVTETETTTEGKA